jgi:ABC-2 type transport system permease protein
MNTAALRRREVAPVLPMLVAQVRSVLLSYWRMPYFTVFSMVLPVMFFGFFGVPNVHQKIGAGSVTIGAYILASMAGYAMSNVLIYNIGIGVANQRARKLDLLQRATPLPGWVAIAGSMVGGLALAVSSLIVLLAFGAIVGVTMPLGHWFMLALAVVFGSLPMLGLGMALGYGAGANTAPALASLIYLPMAFASGLFIPLQQMPDFIQKIGPYLPLYHLGQLGYAVVGDANEDVWKAVLWTVGWSALLFAAAVRAYRMDQIRKFS